MSDWEEVPLNSGDDDWEVVDNSDIANAKAPDTHSKAKTALEHFGRGLTLGYLPHLQAGVESNIDSLGTAKDEILDAIGLDKFASGDHQLKKQGFKLPESSYVATRDANIARQEAQAKEHPILSATSNIAGGIVGGIAAAPAIGGSTAATVGGRLLQGAKTGAGLGIVANPGDKKGELSPVQLKERSINGLIGGGIGLGVQGAVEGVSALAKPVSDAARKAGLYMKDKAEKLKVKSLGGTKKMLEKLQSTPGAENRLGRNLLDNKVGGFFTGREKIASQIDDLADAKTGELTSEINRVSGLQSGVDPEKALTLEAAKFSPRDAAEGLKAEIREQYSHIPEEILEPQLKAIDMWFSKQGRMDIKDVQAFKTQMNNFIRDGSYLRSNPGLAQETLMGVQGKLRRGVEHNADVAAEIFGEAGGKIKSTNQDLGGLYQAQDMIESGVAASGKNQMISLGDKVAAAAGAASSGPWGVAVGLANKVAREKGNQISAHALDKASKFLMRTPRFAELSRKNPQAFNAMVADLAQKSRTSAPEMLRSAEGFDPTQPVDDEKAKSAFVEGN